MYERFAPQDPDGRADPARGIRQFIAGTGGAFLYQPVTLHPNSEVRISGFGVLKLTLSSDRFSGNSFRCRRVGRRRGRVSLTVSQPEN